MQKENDPQVVCPRRLWSGLDTPYRRKGNQLSLSRPSYLSFFLDYFLFFDFICSAFRLCTTQKLQVCRLLTHLFSFHYFAGTVSYCVANLAYNLLSTRYPGMTFKLVILAFAVLLLCKFMKKSDDASHVIRVFVMFIVVASIKQEQHI